MDYLNGGIGISSDTRAMIALELTKLYADRQGLTNDSSIKHAFASFLVSVDTTCDARDEDRRKQAWRASHER